MKLKKLAAICKRNKRAILYNQMDKESGEIVAQFISDENALYPLYGLPVLDERSLLTIFDVEPDKWDDWIVSERPADFSRMNPLDIDGTEYPIRRLYPPIIWRGTQLMICGVDGGEILMTNADYLDPVDTDEADFYVRRNGRGERYLAVKEGLILTAAIWPYQFTTADIFGQFSKEISDLGFNLSKMGIKNLMEEEAGEQMGIQP